MAYTQSQKYTIANSLASDLAERYLAVNMADMMIVNAEEKAQIIRTASETNTDQMNRAVQEYRRTQRAIYSALWCLLDGYGGYSLVKTPNANVTGIKEENTTDYDDMLQQWQSAQQLRYMNKP